MRNTERLARQHSPRWELHVHVCITQNASHDNTVLAGSYMYAQLRMPRTATQSSLGVTCMHNSECLARQHSPRRELHVCATQNASHDNTVLAGSYMYAQLRMPRHGNTGQHVSQMCAT